MLKDITTIKLSGANFDSLTSFDFFDPHDANKVVKGTLVYGRNGTGKSTIARAFRKLSGEDIQVITNAAFCDVSGHPITLTEEEKKHIYVFDEDYVNKNVRLQQGHLETIVMLGPAADLTEKIEQAKAKLRVEKMVYEQQKALFDEFSDANNVKSPEYYRNRMKEALRGDDNWAGRDRQITNARQNTRVTDDTLSNLMGLKPSKPKTDLIAEFKAKLEELKIARTGASTIDIPVPSIQSSYSVYDDEAVQQLLAIEIQKPVLSEREKRLLALIQEGKANELSQRLEVFRKDETTECPFCFQKVSEKHKESLIESIEKVLNQAVKNHQEELQRHIFDQININLDSYEKLEGCQTCVNLVAQINAAIQDNNEKLKKKIANPYEKIITNTTNVKTLVAQLVSALEDLEKARVEYNIAARKTEPIVEGLKGINDEIAYYEVKDLYEQFEQQQKEFIKAESLTIRLKATYEDQKKVVEDLEAQRKNVRIAVDAINACLKYIFFADDRLKIEYVDGVYKLRSHGKSVKPCDVSVGERNIIGLSYFFTSILEGKEEKDAYGEEYLLVIDDPVSSFDVENRIGILSFLKYKLSMFLEGNPNTKALVMTHDLMSFYDLQKIFEEIVEQCKNIFKQKAYSQKPEYKLFEIREGSLKPFSFRNRQEYSELVKIIYAYARGQVNDYGIVVGNMMRQVLEAFSTFMYRKDIAGISTDTQILGQLPEPKYVAYFKNLMYRLVLHGGSHREEQVKAMKDFHFFSLISDSEKRRTAKDVLCFLYLLNKRHLLEHLEGCGNVETVLESWCKDITARAAVI